MPFEIHKPDNKYEIEEIVIFKLKISFLQLTKNYIPKSDNLFFESLRLKNNTLIFLLNMDQKRV